MKKKIGLLAIAFLILFSSCTDIIELDNKKKSGSNLKDASKQASSGMGFFVITTEHNNTDGRTINPDVHNDPDDFKFRLHFSPRPGNNNSTVIIDDYNLNSVIEISLGDWNFTLIAFLKDEDLSDGDQTYNYAKTYESAPEQLNVTQGTTAKDWDEIELEYMPSNGKGFLNYKVTWTGVEPTATNIKITRMKDSAVEVNTTLTSGQPVILELDNGSYEISVVINTATGQAGDTKVARVLRNLTTTYESSTFTAADFIASLPSDAGVSIELAEDEIWANQTITATPNPVLFTAASGGALRYIWKSGTNIRQTGATATYKVKPADYGSAITVTAYVTTRSGSVVSAATDTINKIGIYDETELAEIGSATGIDEGYALNRNYILADNIDLSSITNWTPIGSGSSNSFTGTFDGNGKTITGLTIDSTYSHRGLFGLISNGGTVRNLGLIGGSVKGGQYTGSIAGQVYGGTISNCFNTGSVTGTGASTGGITGEIIGALPDATNSKVENCYNTGTVSGTSAVGGIVGSNHGDVITCYNTGDVSGTDATYGYIGGIIGDNRFKMSTTNNIALCLQVSGADSYAVNVGRIYGIDQVITNNNNNRAREDMKLLGGDTNNGSATKNGANVALGTPMTTVFAGFDTTIWDIPSNDFDVDKYLPRLRVFGTGAENPYSVLPAVPSGYDHTIDLGTASNPIRIDANDGNTIYISGDGSSGKSIFINTPGNTGNVTIEIADETKITGATGDDAIQVNGSAVINGQGSEISITGGDNTVTNGNAGHGINVSGAITINGIFGDIAGGNGDTNAGTGIFSENGPIEISATINEIRGGNGHGSGRGIHVAYGGNITITASASIATIRGGTTDANGEGIDTGGGTLSIPNHTSVGEIIVDSGKSAIYINALTRYGSYEDWKTANP